MSLQLLVLCLVFIAGYASQRGRTCAVSAAFEIAKRRRARRFAGYLFAASCTLAVLSVAALFDPGLFNGFEYRTPTILTVIGGIVFAFGAYVNGRCSLGTIARLGSGDLSRIGTLAGIFGGTLLAIAIMHDATMLHSAPIFSGLPPLARLASAIVAMAVLAILLRRIVPVGFNPAQWSIPRAMLVIGLANGLLIWLARDWSYTSLFRHIARGDAGTTFGTVCFAALLGGAVTAGFASRQLIWRLGSWNEWARAAIGGLLMGIGVALVPGGNDTMLLVGIPLLLPQLLAGYAVVYATLILIALATPDRAVTVS